MAPHGRLAVLAAHVEDRGARARLPTTSAAAGPSSSALPAAAAPAPHPAAPVPPSTPSLKDEHRDRFPPLPGVTSTQRTVVIRSLEPSDEDAYAAFGGRTMWREGWHYPLYGIPTNYDSLRSTAARQGKSRDGGGGELRLVLVETRTEVHANGKAYSWDEIYGDSWYSWDSSNAAQSTFGLCVNEAFQGTGAGRALISRVLEVADTMGIGPRVMTLTVQDINERAWRLYESVGFEFVKVEPMPERELPGYPGRLVPPMHNKHYVRRCGVRRAGCRYPDSGQQLDQLLVLPDGRKVSYDDHGRDGLPVIVCHGGPGNRRQRLDSDLPYVATVKAARAMGLRLIGIDRPGYGGSTVEPGRTIADWAPIAIAVADQLGIGRFMTMGESAGDCTGCNLGHTCTCAV
jgi:ribosomal protein S18 acetylase RimI-like enzyme